MLDMDRIILLWNDMLVFVTWPFVHRALDASESTSSITALPSLWDRDEHYSANLLLL